MRLRCAALKPEGMAFSADENGDLSKVRLGQPGEGVSARFDQRARHRDTAPHALAHVGDGLAVVGRQARQAGQVVVEILRRLQRLALVAAAHGGQLQRQAAEVVHRHQVLGEGVALQRHVHVPLQQFMAEAPTGIQAFSMQPAQALRHLKVEPANTGQVVRCNGDGQLAFVARVGGGEGRRERVQRHARVEPVLGQGVERRIGLRHRRPRGAHGQAPGQLSGHRGSQHMASGAHAPILPRLFRPAGKALGCAPASAPAPAARRCWAWPDPGAAQCHAPR